MIAREIQVSKNNVFSMRVYSRGVIVIPSTAKVAIYSNSGATVIAETNATISAAGEVSYTFLAAANNTIGNNFRLSLIINGIEYSYLFDVAKIAIINDVSDADLFQYIPELRSKMFDHSGRSTDEGTIDTIIDRNLIAGGRTLIGAYISIYISDSIKHDARVDAYTPADGTMTFSPDSDNVIIANTAYVLRDSYSDQIDIAFDYVRADIRRRVKLASGYIDSAAVRTLTTYRMIQMYSLAAIETEGDRWSIRAREFERMYAGAIGSFGAPYDTDGDGSISDDENTERPSFGSIRINR